MRASIPLLLVLAVVNARADGPERVAADVWLVRGTFEPGRQPDGNSVLLRGADGLVLVDSGRHPAHRERIVAAAASLAAPVSVLVNTHWHLDHVGGNAALRAQWPGLTVHASDAIDGALAGFLARYRDQLETRIAQLADGEEREAMQAERDRIDAGAALRPDVVIAADQEVALAGRRLHLGFEAGAVTAGDVWLFDPASRVLIAGDLVTLPAPLLDTACATRWHSALDRLEAQPFEILVPGHGAPMDRAGLRRWRGAFESLMTCAAGDATPGECAARWRADAGDLLRDWPRQQVDGLIGYYVEYRLRGVARNADCLDTREHDARGA